MNLRKNGNMNYNMVVKLGFVLCILVTLMMFILAALTIMFYKANFYNNNYQTQIVNIDNSPKYEKLDINNCSYEALDELEGIGEIKAKKIINNRPYNDIYQLKNKIGEKTFSNIKDYIKTKEVKDDEQSK